LVRLLKLVGFEVQELVDGKQAVAVSSEWQPHVILMDLRMPEVDGYVAARQIKRLNPGIAIIATTSNAFEQANNAEFDGFLLKPLQTDLLFETIARHIAVRYDYDEAPNAPSRPLLDAAKFRELLRAQSLSLWQRLHHYAIAGNKTQIVRVVGEIEQQHKELADTLRNLMAAYRFDTLISLLEQDADTAP
jgi:CheY-like chemotaxis protein